ncbi:aminopeptidase [candidate division KSB1 bacterium]|nr:MAG: aminopeptidase [candidate division KSB1 bacterium]
MRSFVFFVLACSLFIAGSASAKEPEGGLTPSQVQALLDAVKMDAATRTAINAVTNNDPRDLALNREKAAVRDDIFSFSLPTKGMTDQEKSGRCWMFAGLNLLRHDVIKRYKLDDFELSQSYIAFWDHVEKCNTFLEFIIDTRQRDILDREVDHMLDEPVSDGGYWGYVVNLVEKYGVVPKKFMQETKSSASTSRMDYILNTMLRRDAAVLRDMAAKGKAVADLRSEKMRMMADITRVLVINYGEPPTRFEWRVKSDSGTVSEAKIYTPQEFYHQVVGITLSDYVSLASYPIHPFDKNYSINLTRSMADKPDISFVNVDVKQLKALTLKALLDSNRIWFGCDMGHDVNSKLGLMMKGLYDYEALFGVPLTMTKQQRLDYRHSSSNHSMVFTGVDMADGKPARWQVENSWGKDAGDDGFFTMTDEWFDEYVLNAILPKKYLPDHLLAVLQQSPTPLPVWDPSWQSLRW